MNADTTAAEIRATLWDAIGKVRRGEMSAEELNALSRDAGNTIVSMRAALRLARFGGPLDETASGSDRVR